MATILVVDDSAVSRHLLGYTLKREGHHVLSANSGREALDVLAAQPIALVIADLAMPEMDGLTLLRHIRTNARTRHIHLLMLTASGQEEDRVAAEAAGASGFLTKPTSSRDLIAVINRLLERGAAEPPSP